MAEVRSGIQALFAGADFTKEGKMPKTDVQDVCVVLGMTAAQCEIMFKEIGDEGDSVDLTTYLDWVFGKDEPATEDKPAAEDKPAPEAEGTVEEKKQEASEAEEKKEEANPGEASTEQAKPVDTPKDESQPSEETKEEAKEAEVSKAEDSKSAAEPTDEKTETGDKPASETK